MNVVRQQWRTLMLKNSAGSNRLSQRALSFLPRLSEPIIAEFKERCFVPQIPAILSCTAFHDLPARTKWFGQLERPALNESYWDQYGDTIVPLELTQNVSEKDEQSGHRPLSRFNAPLSVFLKWMAERALSSGNEGSLQSLYLAQASLDDLPRGLRDDLPTPEYVRSAGRGDIYATNIWMGLAPTYTPLHRDPNPNLFVQLAGSKTVRLLKPHVGQNVYAQVQARLGQHGSASFRGEEMMQGEEKRLLEEAVWNEEDLPEDGVEAHLESGDGLFIPTGWWHSIKGTGKGVTASVNWWFR